MDMDALEIDKIRQMYPDEWVLIGNPIMDEPELNVLSGIPILHSKDKKELYYLGRNKTEDFNSITVVYTGKIVSERVMTGIFNSNKR